MKKLPRELHEKRDGAAIYICSAKKTLPRALISVFLTTDMRHKSGGVVTKAMLPRNFHESSRKLPHGNVGKTAFASARVECETGTYCNLHGPCQKVASAKLVEYQNKPLNDLEFPATPILY